MIPHSLLVLSTGPDTICHISFCYHGLYHQWPYEREVREHKLQRHNNSTEVDPQGFARLTRHSYPRLGKRTKGGGWVGVIFS